MQSHRRSPATSTPGGALVALGDRIRARRLVLGLTQESLGERARLHRTYVASLERGRRNIPVLTLLRLAHALDVDAGDLVAGLRPETA